MWAIWDLYRYEEWTRQFIMKTFKSYPVIQLPATAHFTETKRGKEKERRAIQTYKQSSKAASHGKRSNNLYLDEAALP
ncbi:hypothetical protein R0I01_09545 [Bacillus pumilus]|nr:hypothetical protein R0I01_09545 [Bacillus pumilus]